MITRATHRVLTPPYPPLYCLRETDATTAAEQRLPAISVVEVLSVVRGVPDAWQPFRVYPS